MGESRERVSGAYDVFINHRGPDTKKTVASLIYRSLIKYGLRVFLDQDELEAGDRLDDKIKSAISSSSVHVAIFSVRYAESSWCLNELVDMLQSGREIIPIFYNVKPGELRHIEIGCYAEAFRNHQDKGRHNVELVERWKDGLKKACEISGMVFNTKEDDLGHLLDEIVENVLKKAKWKLLHVAEHPVGLRQAAEDFNNFLKERQLSGTTVVGIMGLGGSGKSTLVKHLYNCYLQSRKFKRYCFLSELNEKPLRLSQQKLLRDLSGDDKHSITDTTDGKGKLQTCLRGSGPVLIVVDGLDNEEQIESLLLVVNKDVLAERSLILVTCHDKDLLAGHQVNLFYSVKFLQGEDAHDLFCLYAFDTPKPPKDLEDLEDLVKDFVEICCGFPLALKVLGRKLSVEQERRYWKDQLKDLRAKLPISIAENILKALSRPRNIVDGILKDSYAHLEKKEVFLDVAHFLVGEDTDLAVRVLDGLYGNGLTCLKELQSKCLLDLEEIEHWKHPFAKGAGIQWRTKGSSKIRMHDLVRKMATQVAIEDPFFTNPLRLCKLGNTALLEQVLGIKMATQVDIENPFFTKPLRLCQLDNKRLLQQRLRGRNVRGIRYENIDYPQRKYKGFTAPINELRLLVLHGVSFSLKYSSGDLIWLRMHKSNWSDIRGTYCSMRDLRVLELDGVNFEALDCDTFPQLRELTVDYNGGSVEIPERNLPSSSRVDKNSMEASSSATSSFWYQLEFIMWLPNLVKMILKNVKGFKSFPADFRNLINLRHLDLSGWSDLEKMPDSFTELLQLEYLALQDCRRLSILDLGGITKLEYLDFEGCSSLQKLPDKTTAQRELRYLNLMGTSIAELPQNLGQLKNLEQLLISSPYLTSLPHSFYKLGRLRILTLNRCPSLWVGSRISIKHFPYLESLQLWDVNVKTLPQGIAWNNVKVLHVKSDHVREVSFERDQGELPVSRSHSEGSPDYGTESVGATHHNHVNVSPLTELRLVETGISKLCFPPEESLFPDLEIVDLSGSRSLRDVQSLPCNLRSLCLMNCTALTTLPCLSNLTRLRILDISGCHNLEALNLEGLISVEEIAAKDCWTLQSIQGLAQLHKLSYLNFSTSNAVPNSTIWNDILGFPSNASTVILGGANVLSKNAEEMDSLKQSILKEFTAATISDIPTIQNLRRVTLTNMGSYGAILLCVIAKQFFTDFKVSVGDNVYSICRPSSVRGAEVYEETHWAYTFMWSQNSNLFKDLTFQRKSVLDCTIEGLSSTLEESITKAWIVMIRSRTDDGVKICKELLSSLCCIPR